MSFEQINSLSPELFKRYCGIKPDTFAYICEFVRNELRRTQKKSGRPCRLSVEDQVLLTLEYWREYCPQFHLAHGWGLSEPTVCRSIVTKVENVLKRCADFRLPGKKQLRESDNAIEVISSMRRKHLSNARQKTAVVHFGQEEEAHHQVASDRQPTDASCDFHPPQIGHDA